MISTRRKFIYGLALTLQLQIKNECPNNTCSTDLHLDAVAVYENVNGFFVVGTPNLTLNMSVTKSGDPSYGSLFRMTIPNTLLYRKMEQVSGSEVVTCSLENAIDDESSVLEKYKNESLLECSLGNPLKENYGVAYLLHLQIPNFITDDFVQFRMEASTLSKELDQKDNIRILEIKMKNHVETSLSGYKSVHLTKGGCLTWLSGKVIWRLGGGGKLVLHGSVVKCCGG